MEPEALKGGWKRPFAASAFSEGRGRATRGAEDRLQPMRRPILTDSVDSSVGAEDDQPGEDVSLLDNRPVDQKLLRRRNQGHTRRMILNDSNINSVESSPSVERLQTSNARLRHRPTSQAEDDDDVDHHPSSSYYSSSSSSNSFGFSIYRSNQSFIPKAKPNFPENSVSASESESETIGANAPDDLYGRLLSQTDTITSSLGVHVTSANRDVTSITAGNSGNRSNGSRNTVVDATTLFSREPALGDLIDFD